MFQAAIISAVVAALLGFGAGWKVKAGIYAQAELDRQEKVRVDARKDMHRVETAALNYVAGEDQAEARERIVIKEVIRVVSKPVYREQCLDDDGMRILADDARASNARRGLEPPVPASQPAR